MRERGQSVFRRKINNQGPGWLWAILRMNQWTIRAWSQAWKCIYLELRDIEVRDDTGKMCAPIRSVAILLSCLFWQSAAFVLNGTIRQCGHNCQPPTTVTTSDVSSLLHHGGKYIHKHFACISEYDVALTPFSLRWEQNFKCTSFLFPGLRIRREIKKKCKKKSPETAGLRGKQNKHTKKTTGFSYCISSDSQSYYFYLLRSLRKVVRWEFVTKTVRQFSL